MMWKRKDHMDYDEAISELLTRVITLEQQVKELKEKVEANESLVQLTYDDLVEHFSKNPRDVCTRPATWAPKWFFVFAEEGILYVQSGHIHAPNNSNISGSRALDPTEYDDVLAIYQRRKRGENVSSEVNAITQNSSYWFGIFAEMGL